MSDSAPPPPPSEPTGGPGQTGSTGSTGPAGPPPGPPPTTPPNQPPAEQPTYQSTTGSSSMSGGEMKAAFAGAHKFDLAIMGAGVLMFIWSLLPYYTVSFDGGAGFSSSGSVTAWHGFFGWFGALCALGAAILLVLPLLNVRMTIPTRQVVLGLLGFATLCVVIAFFVIPGGDCQGIQVCEDAIDFGHGVGYWLSLLTVIGATALAFMRKDATD